VTPPGRLFGTVGSRRLEGAPEFIGGALSEAAQAQLGPAGPSCCDDSPPAATRCSRP